MAEVREFLDDLWYEAITHLPGYDQAAGWSVEDDQADIFGPVPKRAMA